MVVRKRIVAVAAVDLVLFVLLISFVASPNWWTHWSFRWPVQDPAQITLEVGDVSVELPRPLAIQVVRSILAGPVGLERTVPTDEPPAMLWIAGVEYRWTSPGIGLVADGVLLKYDDPLPPILGELRGAGETPTEERARAATERLLAAVPARDAGSSHPPAAVFNLVDDPRSSGRFALPQSQSHQLIGTILRGPESVTPDPDAEPSGVPAAAVTFPPNRVAYYYYSWNSTYLMLQTRRTHLHFRSPWRPGEY